MRQQNSLPPSETAPSRLNSIGKAVVGFAATYAGLKIGDALVGQNIPLCIEGGVAVAIAMDPISKK